MTAPLIKPQEESNQIIPKFTNRPEKVAQDPSYQYFDASKPWEQNAVSPEAIRMMDPVLSRIADPNIETLSQVDQAPSVKVWDRDKFQQSVFKQFPDGDPWKVNIMDKTMKIFSSTLPQLWKKVFPDIPWEGMLNAEQSKYWGSIKEDLYKDMFNFHKIENIQQREDFKMAMGTFEKNKKDADEARVKLEERGYQEAKEVWKEGRGEAKEKRMVDYRAEKKEPKPPTGTLTENQIAQSLLDLSIANVPQGGTSAKEYAKLYNQYRQLVTSGLSREDAYNQILQGTKKGETIQTGKKSYKHLWD